MIFLFQSRADLPDVVVFHFLAFPADDVNSFFFMDGSNFYVNIVAGSQGSHISSCPTAFLRVEESLPYCLPQGGGRPALLASALAVPAV